MPSITVNLPKWMHTYLKNVYHNKSEAIREAIDLFKTEMESFPKWVWSAKGEPEVNTTNITNKQIKFIDKLKEERIYFSRSEFIRRAVFFMIRKDMEKRFRRLEITYLRDMENYVSVPIDKPDIDGNHHEFKTYKIVKRLEY